MQVTFRFHSLRCSEILVSPSICTKIRTRRFRRTEEVSNNFSVSWHITFISMTISAESGTRYRPQFYKVGLLPSPLCGCKLMRSRGLWLSHSHRYRESCWSRCSHDLCDKNVVVTRWKWKDNWICHTKRQRMIGLFWQKRDKELDNRLSIEIGEMTLQIK